MFLALLLPVSVEPPPSAVGGAAGMERTRDINSEVRSSAMVGNSMDGLRRATEIKDDAYEDGGHKPLVTARYRYVYNTASAAV